MTKGEKLAALLDSKGKGERSALGRKLVSRGLKAGMQMPNRWAKDVGFNERNQRLVIDIYGLPADYFDDAEDGDVEAEASGSAVFLGHSWADRALYESLRRFLLDPPDELASDEQFWLCSQRFDPSLGDLGTSDWWYSELKSYRFHRKMFKTEQAEPTRDRSVRGKRQTSRA